MWQEVRHLVHQVDSQLVVFDTDMHVHATNEQASGRALHLNSQSIVALFACWFLILPTTKRMRGRGDRRQAMTVCDFLNGTTQVQEILTYFPHIAANFCADLDLRT